jgi:hypothetical protein
MPVSAAMLKLDNPAPPDNSAPLPVWPPWSGQALNGTLL